MYFGSKEGFLKSDEKRAEGARMWLDTFNGSGSDELCDPKEFCHDLYNLSYAFFEIRTLLAKNPESVPLQSDLMRGFALARWNVLRRFPYLLNADLVDRSFAALETLFELGCRQKADDLKADAVRRKNALAVTHFFQNALHSFYLGQTRGLLNFDRLMGQLRPPPPVYTHIPPSKLLH